MFRQYRNHIKISVYSTIGHYAPDEQVFKLAYVLLVSIAECTILDGSDLWLMAKLVQTVKFSRAFFFFIYKKLLIVLHSMKESLVSSIVPLIF